LRKKCDLTQEKLADFMCVSYQAVSKWETGTSNPDISLLAPLARLFNVTIDELLGNNNEQPDARRAELDAAYRDTYSTGCLVERHKIAETMVAEYPGDMAYLEKLAWVTAMRSFEQKDDKAYQAEQDKGIKMFETVIENCTDAETKGSAILGITQYMSFRGRKEEARKYADLLPEKRGTLRDDVMGYCLEGDEKTKFVQQKILNNMGALCDSLYYSYFPNAAKIAEEIMKLIISDGNFVDYNAHIGQYKVSQADTLIKNEQYDEAIQKFADVMKHYHEYDKLFADKGVYKYTAPLINLLDTETREHWLSGTGTFTDSLKHQLATKDFYAPLRNRDDFQ